MAQLFKRRKSFSVAGSVLLVLFAAFQLAAQESLRAHAEVLGASAPFTFPEEVIVGPDRNLYFLDPVLSSIFIHEFKTGKVRRLCGPEALASPSDIAIGPKGQLWVISQRHSNVRRLSPQCVVEREFKVSLLAEKIATNAFGELIVLNTTGRGALFDLFSGDGKLLRSFGKRIDYGEEIATAQLSDGKIVPDSAGGFFFSFYYPPLVRHYGRNGRLLSEFKPESDVPIAPPDIQVRGSGGSFSVTSKYQILVLDMAADKQDRLYLLISGKNKAPALQQGSAKLRVLTKTGITLKNITLHHSFHRLAAGNRSLYLLRSRAPLRVDEYVVF
ncbi:MAG TPA: hypothetical protein VFI57_07095 [Pyrinomonadaceae bacterium]|nr:hypothetical protein [Pyrinomonadaceae bacterium]